LVYKPNELEGPIVMTQPAAQDGFAPDLLKAVSSC
jgi:hypothetical protein